MTALFLRVSASGLAQPDPSDLGFIPGRLFGVVTNQTLIAVPLFVFMGVLLEKTKIAESLLTNLSDLRETLSRRPGDHRGSGGRTDGRQCWYPAPPLSPWA